MTAPAALGCLPGCDDAGGRDHRCLVRLGTVERRPLLDGRRRSVAVEADRCEGGSSLVLVPLDEHGGRDGDLLTLDPSQVPALVTLLLRAYRDVRW